MSTAVSFLYIVETGMSWGSVVPLAVVLLVATAIVHDVESCSMPVGWRPLSVEEKLLNAEQVLYAIVRRTFLDDSGLTWRENLYTAEVEVFCIMKGRRTPALVNITDVGLSYRVFTRSSKRPALALAFLENK